MDAAEMLRKQRQARQVWHELDEPPRRALLLRRPTAVEMMRWRGSLTKEGVPEIAELCVVDWRGFTGADLLGAAVGGSDEQPFDAAVFKEWADDQLELLKAVAIKVFELVNEQLTAKGLAEKKSGTS